MHHGYPSYPLSNSSWPPVGSTLVASDRVAEYSPTPNLSVNRTACKLRLQAPSGLRAPAADYLKRSVA